MPLIKNVNDTETEICVTIDVGIDGAMCVMTANDVDQGCPLQNYLYLCGQKKHGWEERPSKGCHPTKITR